MRTLLNKQQISRSSVLKRQHHPTGHTYNENVENGQLPVTKKRRMKEKESMDTETQISALPGPSSSSWEQTEDVDTVAVPSVKALKGWLSGFEKKQKDHYEKNALVRRKVGDPTETRPVVANYLSRTDSANSMASAAEKEPSSNGAAAKEKLATPSKSATIQTGAKKISASESCFEARNSMKTTPSRKPSSRPTGSSSLLLSPQGRYNRSGTRGGGSSTTSLPRPSSLAAPGSTPKPLRFRPRVKKEEVQATDNKNASVHKLAEWLQDDPFEQRKLRAIRKGAQVIAKSRAFESESSVVVAKDAAAGQLSQNGGVADRRKWLRAAFKEGDDDEDTEDVLTVSEKAKWLEKAFKKGKGNRPNGMMYCGPAIDCVDNGSAQPTDQKDDCDGGVAVEDDEIPEVFSDGLAIDDTPKAPTGTSQMNKTGSIEPAEVPGSEKCKSCSPICEDAMRQKFHNDSSVEVTDQMNKVTEPETIGDKENSASNYQEETDADMSLRHSCEGARGVENHSVLQPQGASSKKEGRGVLGAAAAFGGVTKVSSVQRRRQALEQRGKEIRKKADPRSFMLKTTWASSSSSGSSIGGGNYAKKMMDHPPVPKKTLSDLP